MTDARDAIVARIRAATARRQAPPAVRPRRAPAEGDLIERFAERAREAGATLERVSSEEAGPALARRLQAHAPAGPVWVAGDVPPSVAAALPAGDPEAEAPAVAVTGALAGVAETGSLVRCSGADPVRRHFLAEAHVVVLAAGQIVARIEDLWARLARGPWPRAVNLITGPSRTADIEQRLQLGAHGPRQLHIVLVEGPRRMASGDGGV